MRSSLLAAFGLALLAAPALPAQQGIPAELDSAVHRIFASGDFRSRERLAPGEWIEGGAAYIQLDPAPGGGGRQIVRYATLTGEWSVLATLAQLTPAGAAAPLAIESADLSADGRWILLFTASKRVWRSNTRGDYWLFDRQSGALRQLGGSGPPSTMMYATLSPTGDRVAYVRGGDLFVESLTDHAITRLTTDGDSLHLNGSTDWAYEEELGLRQAFAWSPDGARLAYLHFDLTGVGRHSMINDLAGNYPTITTFPYPKVGTPLPTVTLGVVAASGGTTTWADFPGDPRTYYLPRFQWKNSEQLLVQRLNRRQDSLALTEVTAATGKSRLVLMEHDDAWVEVVDDFTLLNGGEEFLWLSERNGFRQLFRGRVADGTLTPLIWPTWDVIGIAGVDAERAQVYLSGAIGDASQRALYRVSLNGVNEPLRITPPNVLGTANYRLSPDARRAFVTHTRADIPPSLELVNLPTHARIRMLAANTAQRAAVAAAATQPIEFFKVNIGNDVLLDGWMIKPANFDSTRRYPVLVHTYGGPAGQTVLDRYGGNTSLWHHALANAGMVVVSFDNRGTPAPRGRSWRKAMLGGIGVVSSADQAAAIQTMTRQHRWMDSTRVAIWGWSGGGTNTLQAMFRYPEIYRVGMSVAGIADFTLYDAIFQERYMGLPATNGGAFDRASAIHVAAGLKGKLLIVHGSADDNVQYQGTAQLVDRLVALGKQFDLMVYPNRSHSISEGAGTTLHLYRLLTRYLVEHLGLESRP